MSIWWCRRCGMEDTRAHDSCSGCGSALTRAPIDWLEEGELGDEIVFELEPEPLERAALVDALIAGEIRHRWDGVNDLVVAESDEETVDRIVEEVFGEVEDVDGDAVSSFGDDGPPGGGHDSGEGYEMLSRLYVSTDKLRKKRNSEEIIDFVVLAGATMMTSAPFGVDDEMWADIQAGAHNVANALEADAEAQVDDDLSRLHQQLQALV